MTEKDSLVGKHLDEYLLEVPLGQGGMARIYRGLDVHLQRYAAIKVISTSFRQDKDYLLRFGREAQAIAQLEHPNIVRLYRFGNSDGLLYMAMQYIEGTDLENILESYRQSGEFMEFEDASRILREIGNALDYIHCKGIIHRDVKSANIMLDKSGQAYLTDFGLVLLTALGTRGEIFGSPHYMAPEQALSSAKAVPESDLYSLGVILYEILTGQLPFDAKDPLDIALMQLSKEPPPPREIRADISPALEKVVLRSLSKKPEERYPTGRALADALDEALTVTRPTIIRPTSSIPFDHTIPGRIANNLLSHPLPPMPVHIQPELPVENKATPAISPPAEESRSRKQEQNRDLPVASWEYASLSEPPGSHRKSMAIVLSVIAGLFLILLCVVGVGAAISMRGISINSHRATVTTSGLVYLSPTQNTEYLATNPPPGITLTTTVSTSASTRTITPIMTPSPSVTPTNYKLSVLRCSDGRCLIVINTGVDDFPLVSLRLVSRKDSIDGSDWAINNLIQGSCVAVSSNNDFILPRETVCNLVGSNIVIDSKSTFWKESIEVYFGNQKTASCARDQNICKVMITPQ